MPHIYQILDVQSIIIIRTLLFKNLGFSIGSDILFITKVIYSGSNLTIPKIISVLDSPGHFTETKNNQKILIN